MPVFGCRWADNKNGVDNSEMGFTRVDLERVGYKDEPFILASQAKQVFFVTDPVDKRWSIVLSANKNTCIEDDGLYNEDDGGNPILGGSQSTNSDGDLDISDDELYMRQDHQEGIWINPSVRRRTKKKVVPMGSKRLLSQRQKENDERYLNLFHNCMIDLIIFQYLHLVARKFIFLRFANFCGKFKGNRGLIDFKVNLV